MKCLEGDAPRLEQLHKEIIKDLGSFLLLALPSFESGFYSVGGKSMNLQAWRLDHSREKGAGQNVRHTFAESENRIRKMIASGNMHLVDFLVSYSSELFNGHP